jgi:hypothetical protein
MAPVEAVEEIVEKLRQAVKEAKLSEAWPSPDHRFIQAIARGPRCAVKNDD